MQSGMTQGSETRKFRLSSGRGGLSLLVCAALIGAITAGCSSPAPDDSETVEQPLTAAISGTISDAMGNPLSGATVTLSGQQQSVATTGATGTFSFAINTPGARASVAVMPTRNGCNFNPSVANLNGITGNRTVNFTGTGAGCVGVTTTPPPPPPPPPPPTPAVDPGPRGGVAGAGAPPTPLPQDPDDAATRGSVASACLSTNSDTTPAPGLSPALLLACEQAVIRFQEVDSVSGTLPGEEGRGLGPTFNGNSCSMCHAEPGVLGSSPGLNSALRPVPNPQVALATLDGARNVVPSFIFPAGPVREGRLGLDISTGKPDGGVHGLFTIAGRVDAQGCNATQPDFATELTSNNVTFRIPTPTFGTGLIESVLETALEANLGTAPAGAPSNVSLGISGVLNRAGNDGTISRFGWKAQNKSLMIFAGEAYNVEQGVSNINFPNEREGGAANLAGCFDINPTPEDNTDFSVNPAAGATVSDVSSDLLNFDLAMELSAPPTPAVAPFTIGTTTITAQQVATGRSEFISVGCGNCHTPSLTTAKSSFDPALTHVTFHPFSDIAIHHMGTGLSDGVAQGQADADQFRSAPLWGVGQRLFFLHDGRTSDIVAAIQDHASAGSEANTVIANFNALSVANRQAVVNFLRSL
jgi:CxxC motif-containing protein (DUF1111 family)